MAGTVDTTGLVYALMRAQIETQGMIIVLMESKDPSRNQLNALKVLSEQLEVNIARAEGTWNGKGAPLDAQGAVDDASVKAESSS